MSVKSIFDFSKRNLKAYKMAECCPCDYLPGDAVTINEECPTEINSLDISHDNRLVATADGIPYIRMFEMDTGKCILNFPVKKYGADNLVWSPTDVDKMFTSSTKINNDLREIAIQPRGRDPTYIKYYVGHEKHVDSMRVTRDGEKLVSSSSEESCILFWDIKTGLRTSSIRYDTKPSNYRLEGKSVLNNPPFLNINFDKDDTICAVACRESLTIGTIKLYDVRKLESGPFKSLSIDLISSVIESVDNAFVPPKTSGYFITELSFDFTDIKFSPNGLWLLINTNGPSIYVINTMTFELHAIIQREISILYSEFHVKGPEMNFSNDSLYIFGGTGYRDDGKINIWSVSSGEQVSVLETMSKEVQKVVKKNKKIKCPFNSYSFIRASTKNFLVACAGGHRITLLSSTVEEFSPVD